MVWTCTVCTVDNERDDFVACETCGSPRAPSTGGSPRAPAPASTGGSPRAPAPPSTGGSPRAPAPASTDGSPAPKRARVATAPPPTRLVARKACFSYDDAAETTDDEGAAPTVDLVGAGARVRACCVADLHRHQWDKFVWVGPDARGPRRKVDLAEWYEDHAPPDVGLAVFAGDLGLEQNDELATETGRGVDRRATGARESGYEKEAASVRAWASLFAAIVRARPLCHVVVVGGNHDGLLCDDDDCVTCGALDAARHAWTTERRRPWGATARAATTEVARRLAGGSARVHVLRDSYADVDVALVGGGFGRLRVLGSALTPRVQADWRVDPGACGAAHNTLLARDDAATRSRWRALLDHATRPSILVCHGPPFGVMDLVGRERRVGCECLADELARAPVAACVFRRCPGNPFNFTST
jgi:hypothetical protein